MPQAGFRHSSGHSSARRYALGPLSTFVLASIEDLAAVVTEPRGPAAAAGRWRNSPVGEPVSRGTFEPGDCLGGQRNDSDSPIPELQAHEVGDYSIRQRRYALLVRYPYSRSCRSRTLSTLPIASSRRRRKRPSLGGNARI